jgi:hypothetical protein
VYCKGAGKLIITLAENSANVLADGGNSEGFTGGAKRPAKGSSPDAVIYSKVPLIIRGGGSLDINSNDNHGIESRDTLVIESGDFVINARNHGIAGKDALTIRGGSFRINCQSGKGLKSGASLKLLGGSFAIDSADDGIHSDTEIEISGGTITVKSGDDGIHATDYLHISGGEIEVSKSNEGIESSLIRISGGRIKLTADDDALNVAGANDGQGRLSRSRYENIDSRWLYITGGVIFINSIKGDGIDLNGNGDMSGGEVYISTDPSVYNGALDYDGSFTISGGILVAAGSPTMTQMPGAASKQPSLMVFYDAVQGENTSVELTDHNGKQVFSYAPPRAYGCIVISTPELKLDARYNVLSSGRKLTEVLLNTTTVSISENGDPVKPSGGMPISR